MRITVKQPAHITQYTTAYLRLPVWVMVGSVAFIYQHKHSWHLVYLSYDLPKKQTVERTHTARYWIDAYMHCRFVCVSRPWLICSHTYVFIFFLSMFLCGHSEFLFFFFILVPCLLRKWCTVCRLTSGCKRADWTIMTEIILVLDKLDKQEVSRCIITQSTNNNFSTFSPWHLSDTSPFLLIR